MSNIDIRTEINYVVEIEYEQEKRKDDDASDDQSFQLVRMEDFPQWVATHAPEITDPIAFWHTLFGNRVNQFGAIENNPEIHYLTAHSCEQILKHHRLFASGIDFQHLPAGFFLTKNPNAGGVRDVLHYSDYMAEHQNNVSRLAISLTSKPVVTVPTPHEFRDNQASWFNFLQQKAFQAGYAYCTEKELRDAFIAFSNTLERLNLSFDTPPDFSNLSDEVNPIVLLGRWETVLTNRNLKEADRAKQWSYLLSAPLIKSCDAIRGITDHLNTQTPCGFLHPAMELSDTLRSYKTAKNLPEIDSPKDFWRYVAFQPKRNTIQFYEAALEHIHKANFDYYQRQKMYSLLAGSATGDNHGAKTPEEEAVELKIWADLCELTDNIHKRGWVALMGQGEMIKNNFIHHISRLEVPPNIAFLKSMADHICDFIAGLNPLGVGYDLARGVDPLDPLVTLSNQLNEGITARKTDFYAGARFYFQNSKWLALDIKRYTELQHHLLTARSWEVRDPEWMRIALAPLVSTFSIKETSQIDKLLLDLNGVLPIKQSLVKFALEIFKDIKVQKGGDVLDSLLVYLKTNNFGAQPYLELLEHLEISFGADFPDNYFPIRKQQFLDSTRGLNQLQKDQVYACHFAPVDATAIIVIESELVIKNVLVTTEKLQAINEQLLVLKNCLAPEDFTLFVERLALMRRDLPADPEVLLALIKFVTKERSLEAFNQIYLCNRIEKSDGDVVPKFLMFMQNVRHFTNKPLSLDYIAVQETLAKVVLHSTLADLNTEGFAKHIDEKILLAMEAVASAHPHVQHYVLSAYHHMPAEIKSTANYFPHVLKLSQSLQEMAGVLQAGVDETCQENMLCLYSLLSHFHKTPCELTDLWEKLGALADDNKRQVLILISRLLDNKQSIEALPELLDLLKTDPSQLVTLTTIVPTPPYPDLGSLVSSLKRGSLQADYQDFSLHPFGPRREDYAFNVKKYLIQKEKFVGLDNDFYTPELGEALDKRLKELRTIPLPDLQQALAQLKAKADAGLTAAEKTELLCLCIEMLARTTSQFDQSEPPKLVSQELNATQVMVLYAMLQNPESKLITEIDTGEGKSRIMMILAAAQAAQGKTVDFLTSDLALAERDYMTYKPFFTALGVRTSLVSLNTPKQLYQKGGVNFSDNSQLVLLRNKCDITKEPFSFMEENEKKRCLLVDEVDKFLHDKSKDSYNYAAKSRKLANYTWVYPHLVGFAAMYMKNFDRNEVPSDALVKEFIHYVAVHDTSEMHMAALSHMEKTNSKQIKTWLTAAYTASKMVKDRHYKVTEADEAKLYTVRDVDGHTRTTRKILVLDNGRPMEGSSFSDGVHQCLCAIENKALGQEAFVILPENEKLRASYPISFMKAYQKGQVFGVSGTTRSDAPRSSKVINYDDYRYILAPRNKPLRRVDENIWAAKDEAQQISFMKRMILKKLANHEPILLIAQDDNQSQRLYQALKNDPEFKDKVNNWQRVHGLTDPADEKQAISKAGIEGTITVSTAGMFGRGVDINAANLFVLCGYVPTPADEKQIKGRTGRMGKPGEFRMIVNLADEACPLNGKDYNIASVVDKAQKDMALSDIFQEEVSKLYALFLEDVHQNFFKELGACTTKLEEKDLLENWQEYLDKLQKDWDTQKSALLTAIDQENKDDFSNAFKAFTAKWMKDLPKKSADAFAPFEEAKISTIYESVLAQKSFFKPVRKPLPAPQRSYDMADDGQARVYSGLFAQTIAMFKGERPLFANTRAFLEGRGQLFPDLMATLHGDRPLFANLRATIARLLQAIKDWWYGVQQDDDAAVADDPGLRPAMV